MNLKESYHYCLRILKSEKNKYIFNKLFGVDETLCGFIHSQQILSTWGVAVIAKVSVCVQVSLSHWFATGGPQLGFVHTYSSVSGEEAHTQTFLPPVPCLN